MTSQLTQLIDRAIGLKPKIETTTRRVTAQFIGREDVVLSSWLALVSDSAAFYLSPPGTGKTATVGALARAIGGLDFYEALMPGITSPDQLFVESTSIEEREEKGVKSISVRLKLGRAANAHLFFADEIWKTDPSVLNPLLDLARADGVRHEGRFVDTPILGFLAASNELPDENGNLAALWSRMIVRVNVRPLDAEGRKRMVAARLAQAKGGNVQPAPELVVEDIKTLQAARPYVELPESVIDTTLDVIQQLYDQDNEGFRWLVEDDRRFGFMMDVLQAQALVSGQAQVTAAHLSTLRWMLWNTPEHIAAVEAVVDPLCRTPLQECAELIDALLAVDGAVDKIAKGATSGAVDALTRVNGCKSAVEAKIPTLSGAAKAKVEGWATALSRLSGVMAQGVGGAIKPADAKAAYDALKAALS